MFEFVYKKIGGYSPRYNRDEIILIIATLLFVLALFFTHLIFAVIYSVNDVPEMSIMNMMSVVILGYIIYLLMFKNRFVISCYLIVITVCSYVIYCVYFLGYGKASASILPVLLFGIYVLFPLKNRVMNQLYAMIFISFAIILHLRTSHIAKYNSELEFIEVCNIFFVTAFSIYMVKLEKIATSIVSTFGIKDKSILSKEAYQDYLTGLWNRRFMELEFTKVKGFENNVIVMSDIDFFKKVNDTYGHNAGDYVLKEISSIFKQNLRETDTVCRWGGEEFLFLMKNTSKADVLSRIERIRSIVEKTKFRFNDIEFNVTVSFGVALIEPNLTVFEGIERADKSMYHSKQNGRNRITKYSDIADTIE